MTTNDLHGFSSDRPIQKVEDDLLGRSGFSKDLADALASWHGKDSLVVALHGDWGSGKSSIKNMAISEIKKLENNKPEIIEFSPWEWAAQDKITTSFFEEISAAIGRKDKSKAGKKLASTLRKYGRYLNTGESLTSGFTAALPTLFAIVAATGVVNALLDETWVKTVTTGIVGLTVLWAVALKWGKWLFESLAINIEATAKEYELSLNQLKRELHDLLKERTSPLLIILDDLDRLTTEQLRMVFQLVKANSEFPNVVFLILFQRDLVEGKLTDGNQSGRDYLEKIIQVPFDIPKIETSRLHSLLFKNLDKIIEQDESASKMFDQGHWSNLFNNALHVYFDNLRNVYRFSSTLSFHFNILKGRTAFEVNPVDLIAIECLRLFEPDVYKEIARSKDIFTKNGNSGYGNSKEITSQLVLSIIAKSTQGKEKYITKLVKRLFPTIEWALGGSYYSSSESKWLREMRICHPSNFDKYFQFSIPSDELSHSDLQEMLKLTANTHELSVFILSLRDRGILKNALAQFESYIDQIPLENTDSFIKAYLDIGDDVDHEIVGFSIYSSNISLMRQIYWLLERHKDLEERGQILLKCFKASSGMSIVESILQGDENTREKSESDNLLADTQFLELKQEFVRKLDELATNSPETLIRNEHLMSFLFRWKRWGNAANVDSWLQEQTNDAKGTLKLLKVFVRKSSTSDGNMTKTTNYISLKSLENFVLASDIQDKLKKIDMTLLDEKELEALKAFNAAMENRKKGIDRDFFDS